MTPLTGVLLRRRKGRAAGSNVDCGEASWHRMVWQSAGWVLGEAGALAGSCLCADFLKVAYVEGYRKRLLQRWSWHGALERRGVRGIRLYTSFWAWDVYQGLHRAVVRRNKKVVECHTITDTRSSPFLLHSRMCFVRV